MAKLNEIIQWCDHILKSHEFKDYAPNGLQIEGDAEVNKILCAVTASQDAIEGAIEQGANLLLSIMVIFGKVNRTRLQECVVTELNV